ncbi:hypothetical protein ABZX62_00350 [Streptomyces flavidovirens]|uniref:hypothetical protein n=1 Tax=Streptomyces flavidovirens TaxID=67298 RepID=UPI0033BBB3C5
MRLDTFHQFALEALAKAPDVQSADAWSGDAEHLRGVHVTFATGAQLWFGITAAAAPGDKWEGPEVPVEGDAPTEVQYPDLYEGGKVTPARAQEYLAAAITNAGNRQVKRAYGYDPTSQNPGFGVVFHNGAKAYCLLHHTARPGQGVGSRAFDLQAAV